MENEEELSIYSRSSVNKDQITPITFSRNRVTIVQHQSTDLQRESLLTKHIVHPTYVTRHAARNLRICRAARSPPRVDRQTEKKRERERERERRRTNDVLAKESAEGSFETRRVAEKIKGIQGDGRKKGEKKGAWQQSHGEKAADLDAGSFRVRDSGIGYE